MQRARRTGPTTPSTPRSASTWFCRRLASGVFARLPRTNLNVAPACKRGNTECTTVTPNCPSPRDCAGTPTRPSCRPAPGHPCRAERLYVRDTQAVIARAQRGVRRPRCPTRAGVLARVGARQRSAQRHVHERVRWRGPRGSTRWRCCRWPRPRRRRPCRARARPPSRRPAPRRTARRAPSPGRHTGHVKGWADRTVWAGGRRRQQCIAVRLSAQLGPEAGSLESESVPKPGLTLPRTKPCPLSVSTVQMTVLAPCRGVIVRPQATFAALRQAPMWLGALVVADDDPRRLPGRRSISTETGRIALVDQWERTALAFGRPLDDAGYARPATPEQPRCPVLRCSGRSLLGPVVTIAVGALVLAVSRRLAAGGGRPTFRQCLAVAAHAGVILALRDVSAAPLAYVRETTASATTVGQWLPLLDEASTVARFLGSLDVFVLWWAALLGIGTAMLCQRSRPADGGGGDGHLRGGGRRRAPVCLGSRGGRQITWRCLGRRRRHRGRGRAGAGRRRRGGRVLVPPGPRPGGGHRSHPRPGPRGHRVGVGQGAAEAAGEHLGQHHGQGDAAGGRRGPARARPASSCSKSTRARSQGQLAARRGQRRRRAVLAAAGAHRRRTGATSTSIWPSRTSSASRSCGRTG